MTAWTKTIFAAGLAAASLIGATLSASALDARFKDADGDLVADAPTDPSRPDRPADADLRLHAGRGPGGLRQGLGRLPQAHGEGDRQARAVLPGAVATPRRSRRCAPAACTSPASTPAPTRSRSTCAGFVPFTMMASKKDEFGYEMEIITYPGSRHREGRGHQGQEDGLHGRDVELGLQGAVGAAARRSSDWRPARITSRCSPASTTTRSSASPTRTIRRRRSPTRSRSA